MIEGVNYLIVTFLIIISVIIGIEFWRIGLKYIWSPYIEPKL